MSVPHTVAELLSAVGETYKAIDIRSVGIREADSWVNVMAVIRLTYEEVETAKARIAQLSDRFTPVQTEAFRINIDVRPFSEWPEVCEEVETQGVLRIGGDEFKLRQRPKLREASGYFQGGYSEIRSFDGRAWPELRIKFDVGGMNPLMEGRFNAAAHLIGYADALEAANHLCELNVSQQSPGSDLSICLPVFATVSAIRVRSPEKRIEVDIEHHSGLSGLKTVVCLRGQTTFVGAPFREQRTILAFSNTDEGLIISGKGSAQFEDVQTDDWLQVRLLHSQIGEIKRDENTVRRHIPPAERNILLEALKLFCGNAALDDLLVRAYNAKTPKRLNESAAFELHVAWLLGLFGLPTVVLGQYEHIVAPDTCVRRATVDILAANQHGKLLLLVACTLNPPKAEDLSNLRYARNILAREVFPETGVHVIPVLFTSATGCPAYDRPEDTFDLVPIVDADQMQNLLRLLREGQEALFFQFLANPSVNSLGDHSQP